MRENVNAILEAEDALKTARLKASFLATAFEQPIDLSEYDQSGLCLILGEIVDDMLSAEISLMNAHTPDGRKGTLTNEAQGVELFDLVTEQWGLTVTDSMRIGDAAQAAQAMGVTIDKFFEGVKAADLKRGTSGRDNVMARGFVPQENVERVRGLLDEVQALCLYM